MSLYSLLSMKEPAGRTEWWALADSAPVASILLYWAPCCHPAPWSRAGMDSDRLASHRTEFPWEAL